MAIKLLHTAIWALLAGCILALPLTPLLHRFDWAIILTVIILAEWGVLALNKGLCPLTGLAARFTDGRADNFDIYLPNWLARHNKAIFGALLEKPYSENAVYRDLAFISPRFDEPKTLPFPLYELETRCADPNAFH